MDENADVLSRLRRRTGMVRLPACWYGDDRTIRVGHSGDVSYMLDDLCIDDRMEHLQFVSTKYEKSDVLDTSRKHLRGKRID